MKKIEIELKGTSPLLMHNIEGADLTGGSKRKLATYDNKIEAEKSAYWMKNGNGDKTLCVPCRCLYGCILKSASYFKVKNRSVKPVIAGSLRIEPEEVSLGTNKYEIDIQSVVIQGARILRARPKLKDWKLNFDIIYNEDYIADPKMIKEILDDAGVKVGLLDFRPATGGRFGTFEVSKFNPVS